MKLLPAIFTTVVLLIVFIVLMDYWGMTPCCVSQVFMAIWAFGDARSIKLKQANLRYGPTGPWTAALGMLFLWILFFPWYLINRDRALNKRKPRNTIGTATENDLETLERLHQMMKSGALTEEEFTREKTRVLCAHR